MPQNAHRFVLATRNFGVFKKPGAWHALSETVPAPDDLKIDVIGVPAGSDLVLDLQLESVVEGVYVSGTVSTLAVGEDVRTLERLELPLEVRIDELYVYDDAEDDEESYRLVGDQLDLEPALRDAVVMALPFSPTREQSDTFDYTSGDDLPVDTEDDDPRWSALKTLLNEKKES